MKIAIAGYGKMGKIRAREILARSDTDLIGVFEQDKEIVTNVPDHIAIVNSFADLLALKPDIVFICAYNNVACEYTIAALKAGCHVFCEKPPAMNCVELSKVIAAEQETGLTLKYGFNHRYHYSVQEAKRLINEGSFGRLLWIRGVYGKAGSIDYDLNWRNFKAYSGGGILMDQGIHMLDLIHHLSKRRFNVVSSILSSSFWNVEVEDNAIISLQDDDVLVTMHSSATQWKHKFLLEMCFEHGFINLDGILSDSRSYAPETMVVGKREFEDITFAMGKPVEQITSFENDHSWKLEIDEFINAIVDNQPILHGRSEDAMAVLSLIEEIYDKSGFYK